MPIAGSRREQADQLCTQTARGYSKKSCQT